MSFFIKKCYNKNGDKMNIALASDHRGFEVKKQLIEYLSNYNITDYGTNSSEQVDYPIYGIKLAESIRDKKNDLGILICGTGIGMSIVANKVKGIRCGRVVNKEETFLTRSHNNANVIAISASLPFDTIKEIVDTFINTPFSNEERHIRRNNMVDNYEA